jgi:hypothetical protein
MWSLRPSQPLWTPTSVIIPKQRLPYCWNNPPIPIIFLVLTIIGLILYIIYILGVMSPREQIRNNLIKDLRNTPSHQLHQDLEYMYRKRISIKIESLQDVERYLSVTYTDDPVAMRRTIIFVEDMAWVMPLKGRKRKNPVRE